MMVRSESERPTQLIRPNSEAKDAESVLGLAQASEATTQQSAFVSTSPLEAQYRAALEEQLKAKRNQAGRVENRLETLIGQEETLMNARAAEKPSFFRPGAVAKWRQDLVAAEAVLQRLHNRLEHVRELRDGMATHGPRLQKLAADKLRNDKPELVEAWEELKEAHRLGVLAVRARDKGLSTIQSRQLGLGLRVAE